MQTHPYAKKLADSAAARASRRISLKARTLLSGFGYHRRNESILQCVHQELAHFGLQTDLGMTWPRDLDDRVTIGYRAGAMGETPAARPTASPEVGSSIGDSPKNRTDPITQAVDGTVVVLVADGTGSGFVVHESGLVVTAKHVVEDGGQTQREVCVRLFSGLHDFRDVSATVFRFHRSLDYALMWLSAGGPYPSLPLGDPATLRHAQTVYAVGSPAGLARTVSRGIVSNPVARQRNIDYIQTDAAIDHGNSGGPLVDSNGRVVGMTVWGIGSYDAAKFAVPIDYMRADIEDALARGRETCLSVPLCWHCGTPEFEKPIWFCRNCGAQGDFHFKAGIAHP